MNKILIILFILSSLHLYGQVEGTVILVRHAEKESAGKDPELSKEGQERSEKLKFILGKIELDAIFSTDYKRTKDTVEPVAREKEIEIRSYSPRDQNFIIEYLKKHPGDAVLVSGHSNTIPGLYNFLTGEAISDFNDDDYSNLMILILHPDEEPRIVWLQY